MTIHDGAALLASALCGALLGLFFWAGLWWTVRAMLDAARGAGFLLASLLLRGALALAGFYWVGHGRWPALLACLFGFLCARALATRWARRTGPAAAPAEARHAP